jgi:hypothetical protein
MRRTLAALALCSLATSLLLRTNMAAASPRRPLCIRTRCTTVAEDRQVRVIKVPPHDPSQSVFAWLAAVWNATGRITSLEDFSDIHAGLALERFALAGRFVAYANFSSYYAEREVGLGIGRVNAKTGQREVFKPWDSTQEGGCVGFGEAPPSGVTALVATKARAVAWIIAQYNEETPRIDYYVCELLPGAHVPALLAHSATVVRHRLTLAHGRLFWREGGASRSSVAP